MSQINSSLDCPRSIENISSLWDQTSTQSVVLVLPDALRSKYYLKDYHGKIEREKARKEREMKRYEFLSQRMATAAMKNRKTMEVILSSERKRARGLVERELDEKMIEPLRKDEKALEFFLQRIQEIKKQRNEHVKKKYPTRPTVILPQESRIIFQEKEKSRLDAAQARRLTRLQSTISTVKYGDNDDNDADDNEGVGDDEYPSPPSSAPWPSNKNLMAAKWLGIVKNFQRLHTLFKVLEKHRKFTAKYELENMAARVIQCRWRRVDMVPKMALVVRQVLAEGGRAQGRAILQHRQNALTILTSFLSLSSGGLKGLVKSFLRKVKKIQGLARSRFRLNLGRLDLLGILFDRTMKILFTFVGHIVAGKVPKSIDIVTLNKMTVLNDPKVIQNFLSAHYFTKFYNYLDRPHASALSTPQVWRNWKTTRQDYLSGKYETDHAIKESLLIDLLIRLRHQHLFKIRQKRVKKSDIPIVSEGDVREFIHGGKDPLQEHIMKLDPIENLKADMISSIFSSNKRNDFPPFLLLQTLTTDDLFEVALVYLEKYCQAKTKREKMLQQLQNQFSTLQQPVGVGKRRLGTLQRNVMVRNSFLVAIQSNKQDGGGVREVSSRGKQDGIEEEHEDEIETIRPALSTMAGTTSSELTPNPPPLSEKPSGLRRYRKLV